MSAVQKPNQVGYSRRNLYFVACAVYTLFIAVGIQSGWASPAIPLLKKEHNFTNSQTSLIASIPNLAPGPLLTIFGIDTIGRKGTLFIIWCTTIISPIIMLISRDFYALLVARFIGGWGLGAAFSAIGIYISEISDVEVRNALNSASMVFVKIGLLITYSVGPWVTFFQFVLICLILSSMFGFFWYFLPESAYYFVSKKKIKKARSSLEFIKTGAPPEFIDDELSTIESVIKNEKNKCKVGIKKFLTSKVVFKQLGISFYLLYLQQGAGVGPLAAYSQEMYDQAKLDFKGAFVPIGLTLGALLLVIPTPLILKRFGTKKLFLMGGYGSGIGLILMGIYFIFLMADYDLSSIKYLPIGLNFVVTASSYVGFGGAIWSMVADLFAPSVKGLATGICGIFSTLMGFVATELFGELKGSLGYGYTFLGFGAVQCIASVGIFFVVDTTKLTLQEIQDYFEGKRKTPRNEAIS